VCSRGCGSRNDKAWNVLLAAYAASAQYELVRKALDEMAQAICC
jgi:pentatricopeptide repeat protein